MMVVITEDKAKVLALFHHVPPIALLALLVLLEFELLLVSKAAVTKEQCQVVEAEAKEGVGSLANEINEPGLSVHLQLWLIAAASCCSFRSFFS